MVPKKVTETLASVPAPRFSPVTNVTSQSHGADPGCGGERRRRKKRRRRGMGRWRKRKRKED